jgi:hypothetical protein
MLSFFKKITFDKKQENNKKSKPFKVMILGDPW